LEASPIAGLSVDEKWYRPRVLSRTCLGVEQNRVYTWFFVCLLFNIMFAKLFVGVPGATQTQIRIDLKVLHFDQVSLIGPVCTVAGRTLCLGAVLVLVV
jgi:hypothetical protein